MNATIFRFIIAAIVIASSIIAAGNANAQSEISAKAALDSAYMLMGKQTALHIEVVGQLHKEGKIMVIDTMWHDIEIVSTGSPQYKDLGNNRTELKQDIIIQGFDSGMYALPPVIYIQPGDTVATNSPVLKVVPVAVDSLSNIHDYADTLSVTLKISDYVPDWLTDWGWWILLLIALLAICYILYRIYLAGGKNILGHRKQEPPYERAMRMLNELKMQKLIEHGKEKEFHTHLSDILRTYLAGRFEINAMEMTTSQIKEALRKSTDTQRYEQLVSRVLDIADFVKFANIRPLASDNEEAFDSALKFVSDTKPQPLDQETSTPKKPI